MLGKAKVKIQNRVEQLEWIICGASHDWVEVENRPVSDGKYLVKFTCGKCGKEIERRITPRPTRSIKEPIGFKYQE